MSKDQTTKQTSSQEDSLANPSVLQEKEKEQMMIATSGTKLLESLEKQNQGGLLEKMLKALLTSKTAWYSDRCKMIWKEKVSKSNVLLFQLQASVRGIKGKESGLLPTPRPSGEENPESLIKRKGLRKAMQHNLTARIKMFPTPNTMDHIHRKGMRPSRAATNRKSGYLSEMIGSMYPTPQARDYKDSGMHTNYKKLEKKSKLTGKVMMEQDKVGGKLNPEFVEFLMGYPLNWTKIETTE